MTGRRAVPGTGLAPARNIAKTWLLVALLAAAAGGIGWLLGGLRPALLFAFASLLASTAAWWSGDRVLLGMLGARPFALAEDPLLRSTTDRLAAQLGVPAPRLYLVDDGFPRAFAVGRGPRGATIAVSTGLVAALHGRELEAVLAHELAHIRSRDVLAQTFAVVVASTLVEVSRVGGWLSRALLHVTAPLGAAVVHFLLSPKREAAADAVAAALTDPHDVADALLRLDRASELVSFAANPATEPLYPVDPFGDGRIQAMFRTHPPLEGRVERLRGLDGE